LLLPPSMTHLRSLLLPPPPSEALNHFKAFNKVNTNAMFNEIDLNNDSEITIDEWKGFWENLLQTGIYKPEARDPPRRPPAARRSPTAAAARSRRRLTATCRLPAPPCRLPAAAHAAAHAAARAAAPTLLSPPSPLRSLSPQEIESELETLLRGEAWVDWNDNRHT